ncbi:MAG: DUF2325 domain-containing protein [Rhodoferax sp.]
MCDHDASPAVAPPAATPCPAPQAAPSTGSRRRRLWELAHQCHCPVIGVCLPLDNLRRLVSKALGGRALADDYEVHVGAVAECGHRSRLSELLQHELEQRYARRVQQFRSAKTTEAVVQLWKEAVAQGDVTGAFWAALTHPRCDIVLQEVLCRDMHMLQHQAGTSVRVDIARFNALAEANAGLTRELDRAQERNTRFMADKASDMERLSAQLLQARADNFAKDSSLAFLNADMTALKASIPGFESGLRLHKKIDQMTARQTELEAHISDLRQKLASATKLLEAVNEASSHQAEMDAAEPAQTHTASITVYLHQKTVLCVGGRSGNVASYRDLIERVGGRFAHHDGGLEDNHNVLHASLAAADLVICQTGCISHNAYWKVKDFCKRTGKRCVFVENPSTSSLARGLEQISANSLEALPALHPT